MKIVTRIIGSVIGLLLAAAGVMGLVCAYFAEAPLGESVRALLEGLAEAAGAEDEFLEAALVKPALRFSLLPIGILALFVSLRRAKGEKVVDEGEDDSPGPGLPGLEKRVVKKTLKQAAALRKNGQPLEAAEMLLAAEQFDVAATYFVEAGEPGRAAEIRHDQNRFLESAELHLEGGDLASAAVIFAQQEEYARAADCYLKDDSKSTAAEMFEKAKDYRRAGDCYREVGFLRHAAQAYVKCNDWALAAECLEKVHGEESSKSGVMDPKKHAELEKLVRQTGKLYRKAKDPERALAILERGGCHADAAEIALLLSQHAKAAELFLEAGNSLKAAEALETLGEHEAAARVLGEHHRDAGETLLAADHFEKAGEFGDAGDLFRQLEDHGRAAACFSRQGDHGQAAEMFLLAGDRVNAADAYEQARRYTEAAECCALAGLGEREAELLAKSGDFLGAGEAYRREGIDEAAIKVLQQVERGEGFARAAALLGDIFQARGQLSLAINKLKQALGDDNPARDNLPAYYTLATVYEANNDHREALAIYEKILAIDYHHRDVEERLVNVRAHIEASPLPEQSVSSTVTAGTASASQPGRYQIVGELGRGGMGIVYKAQDTVLDRLVAFKVLPDSFKENPQALRNFQREAKAAAKLNHPNIVTVYDTGEQDGRYYIAMEYVDGTTLKEILRRRGTIAPAGILHVLVQMCEALAYAHAQKVVHRDVKTANTMWTRDKKAKLMDFGLARVIEEVRNHTTVVSGTPYYMSPEQTLGKNIDHRTDIYSLGVSLFEMATGTVPFKEGNIPYHHVHTPPPDVRTLREDLPESIARVIDRCLEKDPAHRYQTTQEILDELRSTIQAERG